MEAPYIRENLSCVGFQCQLFVDKSERSISSVIGTGGIEWLTLMRFVMPA